MRIDGVGQLGCDPIEPRPFSPVSGFHPHPDPFQRRQHALEFAPRRTAALAPTVELPSATTGPSTANSNEYGEPVISQMPAETTTGASDATTGNGTRTGGASGGGSVMRSRGGVGSTPQFIARPRPAELERPPLLRTPRRAAGEGRAESAQLTTKNCSPRSTRVPRAMKYRRPGSARRGSVSGCRMVEPFVE